MSIHELKHTNVTQMAKLSVFDNVNSIDDLIKAIKRHAEEIDLVPVVQSLDDTIDQEQDPGRDRKVFCGNAFEVFSEFLCKDSENNTSIGVRQAEPVPINDDLGVDLIGIAAEDNVSPATVQCKFKSKPTHVFNYRELATWLSTSAHRHGAKAKHMVLITTGDSLRHTIEDVVGKDVIKVINYTALKAICDVNQGFWDDLRLSVHRSALVAKERINIEPREYQANIINTVGDWL